ncbi:ABC transporter substrate-binding protein [Tessaracoccus defluvii]|uniref:Extracellular solute-binding protein n=1 Tax=Tessaracoccus defluvii TaxID=1285901 RepID=A0A7H0H9G8_9ACTN|nr:extracellular solute-binding protein [Tessaracoccus defluvii]QNP57184.1 extracellular solute-binding protein [Tessaracoccus defluvii]
MFHVKTLRTLALTATAVSVLALAACTPGSLGSTDPTTSGSGKPGAAAVEITVLVDNAEQSVKTAQAIIDGFNASQSDVKAVMETRPQGTDGDNIVKTRLATGEMTDVFVYNSGSLMAALDPQKNLVPITDEPYMDVLDESFKTAVSSGDDIFGAPVGQAMAGGVLYNKKVYADLGLEVPKTWDAFMANNAKIKEAGIDPVIQTYGETWTSQLLVLADFHNVTAVDGEWAAKFTANKAKFADEPAIKGFQRLQDVHDAGYLNKDFASAKLTQGMQALVDGKGAHYPMLTFAISAYVELADDAAENIGFFAQPGDTEDIYGLTAWTPGGAYIPTTTTGEKLDAAKKFLAYIATTEACDAQSAAMAPTGPYMVKGCTLPDGLPTAVNDLQGYFDEGNVSPALEFVSPVKGPNLEKITVEVGSGIATAADGAARYDEDVKKQAQQLGLEGW